MTAYHLDIKSAAYCEYLRAESYVNVKSGANYDYTGENYGLTAS